MVGNNLTEIEAQYTHTIYYNDQNGYSVILFKDIEREERFKAVGYYLPHSPNNVAVKLYGTWKYSEKFKENNFEVTYYETCKPSNKDETIKYLISLKCGVGAIRAKAIWHLFQEDTWRILEEEPEKLVKVPGIGKKQCARIAAAVKKNSAVKDLIKLFSISGIEIPSYSINNIHSALGEDAYNILLDNPYKLCVCDEIPFTTADQLAKYLNISHDAPIRLEALILYILNKKACADGHVCLPKNELLSMLIKHSQCSDDKCFAAVNKAVSDKLVKIDNGFAYGIRQCIDEDSIVHKLAQLTAEDFGKIDVDVFLDEYERDNFKLSPEQREAVKTIFSSNFCVVTGGPGVGKTTVMKAVLYVHQQVYGKSSEPVLLAPTGKAARRMSEATGTAAYTIHSAVGWRGEGLPVDDTMLEGNLFLIDEASMIDQQITAILLSKIPDNAKVVFVGDIDQLPSVGCGNVLHDLIASEAVPVVKLSVIYRQAGTSPIIVNSHAINHGSATLVENENFAFIDAVSDGDIFSKGCKLYYKCAKKYGADNVILLNPQRNNTALSVTNFNLQLQALMNPAEPGKKEIVSFHKVFREGDRVMQMKNTERAKNGDVGYIHSITTATDPDDSSHTYLVANIEFNGDGAIHHYTVEEMGQIDLAYCTTIHKAQGSGATRS